MIDPRPLLARAAAGPGWPDADRSPQADMHPRPLPQASPPRLADANGGAPRIGVVSNVRSHRNKRRPADRAELPDELRDEVRLFRPGRIAELAEGIAGFARDGVDLIVIDGGDGTIRDVLTCAGAAYGGRLPRFAIVPSGKTNALALDLGLPAHWTLRDALAAARTGRVVTRAPIEIVREGSSAVDLRGFLLGAGNFVRATELAQHAHRAGAFNSFAVGVSIGGAILQTLLGGARNPWRAGEAMRIDGPGLPAIDRRLYLFVATTIERLPLGIAPFGPPRPGMKLLSVDAPPRRLALSLPALLGGRDSEALDRRGYRRFDAERFTLAAPGGFILDGELYDGGTVSVGRGDPIGFVVP